MFPLHIRILKTCVCIEIYHVLNFFPYGLCEKECAVSKLTCFDSDILYYCPTSFSLSSSLRRVFSFCHQKGVYFSHTALSIKGGGGVIFYHILGVPQNKKYGLESFIKIII